MRGLIAGWVDGEVGEDEEDREVSNGIDDEDSEAMMDVMDG